VRQGNQYSKEFEGDLVEGIPNGHVNKYNCSFFEGTSHSKYTFYFYPMTDVLTYVRRIYYNYCFAGNCDSGHVSDENVILRSFSDVHNDQYFLVYSGDILNGKFHGRGRFYKA